MVNKEIKLIVPELCQQPGADPAETMAFGDGLNDATMQQTAEVGVAISNATLSVKNTTDFITDTNNHDGFAKVCSTFVWTNKTRRR